MVFASPSANFCTGSNSRRLSGHSHRDNFIVTANLSPLIGTVQKHMPTLTRTATNPNPLAVVCNNNLVTVCPLAPLQVLRQGVGKLVKWHQGF